MAANATKRSPIMENRLEIQLHWSKMPGLPLLRRIPSTFSIFLRGGQPYYLIIASGCWLLAAELRQLHVINILRNRHWISFIGMYSVA